MAVNLFRVEKGFSIDDNVDMIYGVDNPAIIGVDAPKGSVYFYTPLSGTPALYQKTDTGLTDWTVFSSTVSNISLVSELDEQISKGYVKEIITYVAGKITIINYQTILNVDIYTKSFIYNGNRLSSWTITRISNNEQLVCTFIYTNGKLTNKEYSN